MTMKDGGTLHPNTPATSMEIVTGPARSVHDAVRHVHAITFEYADWNPTTESYRCRGVWRNANLSRPVAQTTGVYATETKAIAAAAQAFLAAISDGSL